jgi:competence protein ComEC
VPANLIAGTAVAPATVLGFVGAAAASASIGLARPVLWLGALPTIAIAWTAHLLAALPGAAILLSRRAAVTIAVVVTVLLWRIARRRVRRETREIP